MSSPPRLFVPEVVQTSTMDCGPASLASLLQGFGIEASYARLREACQTTVDGTSIDVMEEVAIKLGLDAEQIMVPADHLPLATAESLPAIVVTCLPGGNTHFVVLWSSHFGLVQLMDPATGRRWTTWRSFADELFIHRFTLPAADFRAWAASEGFLAPLRERLRELHLGEEAATALIGQACADPGWRGLAALDAATRMAAALARAGGLRLGAEVERAINQLAAAGQDPATAVSIPEHFWFARPVGPGERTPEADEEVTIVGPVLVRVRGVLPERGNLAELSPDLAAVLSGPRPRPDRQLLGLLGLDGWLAPGALLFAIVVAALSVTVKALLLQATFHVGSQLGLLDQRVAAIAAMLGFIVLLCILELAISASMLRVGRRLDVRLRVTLFEKIARLGDRYFHSRLVSDMVQRAHDMRYVRTTPKVITRIAQLTTQILLTTAGLIWIYPDVALLAVLVTLLFTVITVVANPILSEYDMRLRTQAGTLNQFYLDTLLGLVPLRMHGAARTMRRQHELLLADWIRSQLQSTNIRVISEALQSLCYLVFAVLIVAMALNHVVAGEVLLLLYWSLDLSLLARQLVDEMTQYPQIRNRMLRLLEILGAPDEVPPTAPGEAPPAQTHTEASGAGVAITLEGVTVQAGGQVVLNAIDLTIGAGEHIAVVGPSGAGKSSLAGLLLGWHAPVAGTYCLDGAPVDGARLVALRQETAWVDPAAQLWNRSLLANLEYGRRSAQAPLGQMIEESSLFGVLDRMPEGLQTPLGEGGGLVSGGEGQRVRLGRAMNRPASRLVILDEPFRGLDREKRRELLGRVRAYWPEATLICITHDIAETRAFARVLVVEDGVIIEDDAPEALAARPDSRYSALLEAEVDVTRRMWESDSWRRIWLANGQVAEQPREAEPVA